MRGGDLWSILGVPPTHDRTAIRRAYAARLKQVNPEDDAEGFQALREAYEHALALAAHRAWADEEAADDAPAEMASQPEPPPAEDNAPEEPASGPWGAPTGASDHVTRREIEALNAALGRLAELVHADEADPRAVVEALRAVLASPAMDAVGVREQVEARVGAMVMHAPNAAPLVDPAIAAFGWSDDRFGSRSSVGEAVLARREDLAFLMSLKRSSSDHHGAWRALTEKPVGRRLWRNRLTVRLPTQVRELLAEVDASYPQVAESFDPEALGWWRDYLSKAQFGPVAVYVSFWAPTFAAAPLAERAPFGLEAWPAFAVAYLAGVVALVSVFASAVGLLRARRWWTYRGGYAAPPWQNLGWAPVALGLLFASSLAPQYAGIFHLGGVAAWAWAVVTAEHHDEPRWMQSAIRLFIFQIPFRGPQWFLRTLGLVFVAAFWLLTRDDMGDAAWQAVGVSAMLAGFAFAAGHDGLASAWRELSAAVRMTGLAAGLLVVAALPFWLWWVAPGPDQTPVAFAAVIAVVLLERIVAMEMSHGWRDYLYLWGWLPALIIGGGMETDLRHGAAGLLFGGLWLLAAAAAGLTGQLRRERLAMGVAYA